MKFNILSRAVLTVLIAVSASIAQPTQTAGEPQFYSCGMHPHVIAKEPGSCPICGMALTPIRSNAAVAKAGGVRTIEYYKSTMMPGEVSQNPGKDSMGMDMVPVYSDDAAASSAIQIDTGTIQRMNLKTGVVTRGPVTRDIRIVGTVDYDEGGLRDITTKYEGWIERLHVDATWTRVAAGEPLFEIYSPDLYNAQLNYLVALRTEGATGGPLTRAALARLQLFDISKEFLDTLARTGEASRNYTYRAPSAGYVIEKNVVAGQMVRAGERIYRIADLSTVWVHAQFFEQDLPFVHVEQTAVVRVTYGPEREFPAKVALLLPRVEAGTRAATARLVLANADGYLRPGMFVDVRLSARLAESAVLVPESAVLRSGERNTVFIALPRGGFEPREVSLGARDNGGRYQVLSGLAEGDRIVTSGQFMLDSESQRREAIEKMLRFAATKEAPAEAHAGHGDSAGAPAPAVAGDALAAFTRLAEATMNAAEALADDDLPGYRRQLPAIRGATKALFAADAHAGHGPLAGFEAGLRDPADIGSARLEFVGFSTAVADIARANGLHHRESLHVFECTMAPGTGAGRWLQRGTAPRNPFFGSAMPACGEELP